MLAVGLGLPAALLSLIPLMAIVAMPVAFAGGVLVALDTLGLAQPGRQRNGPRHFSGGSSSECLNFRRWNRPGRSSSGTGCAAHR